MHFAHYSHGILKSVSRYVFLMYTALCTTYQSLLTFGSSLYICDLAALICAYGLNKTDCSESLAWNSKFFCFTKFSFSMRSLKVDLQQRIEVLWTNKQIPRILHKQTYSLVHYTAKMSYKNGHFSKETF